MDCPPPSTINARVWAHQAIHSFLPCWTPKPRRLVQNNAHTHYKEPGAQSTYRSYTDWICVGNLHTVVKIWGLCVKLARGRLKMRSLVKLWFHFSHLWKQCWPSAPFVVWASFTTNLPGSDSNGWEGTDVWHSRSLMGH